MNPDDLDLNLLRVFDAVLRRRSVTAAGEERGLTQAGVSNALARKPVHPHVGGCERVAANRWLRELVVELYAESGSALARAGDLVGSVKGRPTELASNPRYLRGYSQ